MTSPKAIKSSTVKMASNQFNEGQLVFLKGDYELDQADLDKLVTNGPMSEGTLDHPALILGVSADGSQYHITTISAYSWGPLNNYQPPWKQSCHSQKEEQDFRALVGSEKPNNKYDHLHLEGGRKCPKSKASWIYIQRTYLVPSTALKIWWTTRNAPLDMTQQSLADLTQHMEARNKNYCQQRDKLRGQSYHQPQHQPRPTRGFQCQGPANNHRATTSNRRSTSPGTSSDDSSSNFPPSPPTASSARYTPPHARTASSATGSLAQPALPPMTHSNPAATTTTTKESTTTAASTTTKAAPTTPVASTGKPLWSAIAAKKPDSPPVQPKPVVAVPNQRAQRPTLRTRVSSIPSKPLYWFQHNEHHGSYHNHEGPTPSMKTSTIQVS
ncbi:Uu.00g122740.m01.CDS01 [Anthostomella pinea]|uniref:Uu.00g122740.m01.CDS01 n=1 Tax=Anthostomella pinea TaxID=933095 RepID=A0AAI8VH93_9PEZI|nr:Uu.00g122740.m01.CDS01 [Anthostomella pinea]